MHAELLQPCLTLCNPMYCSPPGSSVHGILQATILEWVAMPSSRESSQPRDQSYISYISYTGRRVFTTSATRKSSVYTTLHLSQQPREVLYTNPPSSAALQRSKVSVPGSHREAGPRTQCSLQSPLPFYPVPRVNRQDHAISSSIRRHREADILKVHGPDNRQNASETTSEAKWKEGGKHRSRGRADKITVGQKSSSAPAR